MSMPLSLYLIKEHAGLPIGTEIVDYVLSQDMFKPAPNNKIYIASYNGKQFVCPPECLSFIKPTEIKKRFDKEKALELIKTAEKMLYDKWMIGEDNEFKTFLIEHNKTVEHSPRLCLDCNELATCGCYCDKCIWSHEPGY